MLFLLVPLPLPLVLPMASIYGLEKQWIFLDSFFFLSFILSLLPVSFSVEFFFFILRLWSVAYEPRLTIYAYELHVFLCVLVFVNCGCSCTTIREIFSASRQNIFSQLAESEWGSEKEWAKEREGGRDERPLLAMTRTSVLVRNSLHNFKQMLLLFNFLRCCRRCSAVAAAAGAKRRRRVWQSGTLKFMVHWMRMKNSQTGRHRQDPRAGGKRGRRVGASSRLPIVPTGKNKSIEFISRNNKTVKWQTANGSDVLWISQLCCEGSTGKVTKATTHGNENN